MCLLQANGSYAEKRVWDQRSGDSKPLSQRLMETWSLTFLSLRALSLGSVLCRLEGRGDALQYGGPSLWLWSKGRGFSIVFKGHVTYTNTLAHDSGSSLAALRRPHLLHLSPGSRHMRSPGVSGHCGP